MATPIRPIWRWRCRTARRRGVTRRALLVEPLPYDPVDDVEKDSSPAEEDWDIAWDITVTDRHSSVVAEVLPFLR